MGRGTTGEMFEQAGKVGSIEAAMRLHVYSVFTLMKVGHTPPTAQGAPTWCTCAFSGF